MIVYSQMDSPVGSLLLTGRRVPEDQSACDFALTGIYMQSPRHPRAAEPGWKADASAFGKVVEQLSAYFAGERQQFDLPTAAQGTPFQHKVWAALCAIPYGETWTYGELAAHIGQPSASRAVGMANGRNPLSIIVPCHRVIGANGQLTGYGGGMERKQWLLAHEGAWPGVKALFG